MLRRVLRDPKLIAVVLYPGVSPLDVVGLSEVFSALRVGVPYRTVAIAERIEPLATDTPLRLLAERTFGEVPRPFGLIVPGGSLPAVQAAMSDPALVGYVQTAAVSAEVVGSVGSGSLILGAAGLLRGRQATTHWAYADLLEDLGAHYRRQRWVEDGRVITSAGVSAGIDMALYLVSRLTSESTARRVQTGIEYSPEPPYGGIDWSRADRDALTPILRPQPASGSPPIERAGKPDPVHPAD